MYIYIYVYTYLYIYMYMYVYIYIYTHICVYICIYVSIFVSIMSYIHTCVHTMFVHKYIYIYIYTHAYSFVPSPVAHDLLETPCEHRHPQHHNHNDNVETNVTDAHITSLHICWSLVSKWFSSSSLVARRYHTLTVLHNSIVAYIKSACHIVQCFMSYDLMRADDIITTIILCWGRMRTQHR